MEGTEHFGDSWQNGTLHDYPCGGPAALFRWLGLSVVKSKALHVNENATMFSGDNGIGFYYDSTERNLLPFYNETIMRGMDMMLANGTVGPYNKTEFKVLIYNGDTDPTINTLTAQNWTRFLDLNEKAYNFTGMTTPPLPDRNNLVQGWRPWTLDGYHQPSENSEYGEDLTYGAFMGGYVTVYEEMLLNSTPVNASVSNDTLNGSTLYTGTMWFTTVRGAGHMVPQYKPRETKVMLDYFMGGLYNETQLPPYIPPGTQAQYQRQ